MQLDVRPLESAEAVELHLTARPDLDADPAAEARRIFAAIHHEAERCRGRICRERVFVPGQAVEAYQQAFRHEHGPGAAEIPLSWLMAGPGAGGGVQAHIVAGGSDWRPLLDDEGRPGGWTWQSGPRRWAVTRGLCRPGNGDDLAATHQALEAAERLLRQADLGLGDVARTWFFLDRILDWYGQFNTARNRFFKERGLLQSSSADGPPVPASTGMGVTPACRSRLLLEVFAVAGPDGCLVRRPAAGKQRCAYEYGSAFARAATAHTPAGQTFFISGTAAIDAAGRTCFIDDGAGQIGMTLDNVQAVLTDLGCPAGGVVQAIAYCKTPEIATRFVADWQSRWPWPWLVVVGDVCRDDLLFEAEVTACRAAETA